MCRSSLCAGMITDTYGVGERGWALFIGSAGGLLKVRAGIIVHG